MAPAAQVLDLRGVEHAAFARAVSPVLDSVASEASARGALATTTPAGTGTSTTAPTGSTTVSAGEKYSMVSTWDSVLGLDLERAALEGWEPSPEVNDLVRRRDEARQARDYATSDGIRKQLIELGLEVMDTADGTRVRPRG